MNDRFVCNQCTARAGQAAADLEAEQEELRLSEARVQVQRETDELEILLPGFPLGKASGLELARYLAANFADNKLPVALFKGRVLRRSINSTSQGWFFEKVEHVRYPDTSRGSGQYDGTLVLESGEVRQLREVRRNSRGRLEHGAWFVVELPLHLLELRKFIPELLAWKGARLEHEATSAQHRIVGGSLPVPFEGYGGPSGRNANFPNGMADRFWDQSWTRITG